MENFIFKSITGQLIKIFQNFNLYITFLKSKMSRDYQSFVEEASNYPNILNEYKKTGKIFTDNNFYQNDSFRKRDIDEFGNMEYIRLDEMYKAPLFEQDAIHQNYITQGGIGDCYMLAAHSRVAVNSYSIKSLFETVQPNLILGEVKDSFNIECGAVVVYLRAHGRITPILIDTTMPYKNGHLRFSRPVDINKSAWFCLIEKAYAKLIGCYADIIGGNLPLAIHSMYNFYYPKFITFKEAKKSDDELFAKILKYYRKQAVMGTSIDLKNNVYNVTEEDLNDKGLVSNHCYALLKVKEFNKMRLFCLRNPWGHKEWNGDYSDKSPLWDKNPELKKKCKWEDKEDGTFWMCEYVWVDDQNSLNYLKFLFMKNFFYFIFIYIII
ncbi:hypothetical protein M9Y10_007290 [Tritrichomonas musculus]|uniref:Calpain catalytic domain-containing protein n=1 Tax=Tritrichomonas musculus TaxID=1915356 RepID=A0ABR2J0X7_9EUKA